MFLDICIHMPFTSGTDMLTSCRPLEYVQNVTCIYTYTNTDTYMYIHLHKHKHVLCELSSTKQMCETDLAVLPPNSKLPVVKNSFSCSLSLQSWTNQFLSVTIEHACVEHSFLQDAGCGEPTRPAVAGAPGALSHQCGSQQTESAAARHTRHSSHTRQHQRSSMQSAATCTAHPSRDWGWPCTHTARCSWPTKHPSGGDCSCLSVCLSVCPPACVSSLFAPLCIR